MSREREREIREIREQEIRMAEWCPVGDMAFLLSIIDEQRQEIERIKIEKANLVGRNVRLREDMARLHREYDGAHSLREQQGELVEALRRLTFALESYEWSSTLPSQEFHAMINAAQDAIEKTEGGLEEAGG